MNKLALISATALAALAASAGTASANSFCVQDADCVAAGGKNEGNNLQAALNDAAILNGDDEVHVGPGGYGQGPFAYNVTQAGNSVDVIGGGQGATTLNMVAQDNTAVLRLRGPSSVSNLSILTPGGGNIDTGLDLPDPGADADGVEIAGSGSSVTGVHLGGGTFEHGSVTYGLAGATRAVTTDGAGGTVADANLVAGAGVFAKAPTGTTHVERTRIRSGGNGLEHACGKLDADSTLIDIRTAVNYTGYDAINDPCAVGIDNTARLRHLTVLGGAAKGAGIFAPAGAGAPRTVAVSDSIIAGFPNAVIRTTFGGESNVSLDHSAYDASTIEDANNNGGTGSVTQTNALGASFGFVDPAADFRLRDDSPLVDAGDPAGPVADESQTDVDGASRVLDGDGDGTARSDVGAFEHGAVAPPPSSGNGNGGGSPSTPSGGDAGSGSTPSTSGASGAGGGSTSTTTAPSGAPATGAQALRLTLGGSKRQRLGRKGRVVVTASADVPVTLTAGVAKAKPVTTAKAATSTRIVVKLPRTTVRTARSKLARHKRVAITVTVAARDGAGQTATATRRIALAR